MNNKSDYFKSIVINSIPRGKKNAVKQETIKNKTGLNKREIRKLVQELRHDGYPICSTTYDGYWIATDEDDIDACIAQMTAQIKTLNETVVSLLVTKSEIFGE